MDFFNVLTGLELFEMTEALLPEHSERLYLPAVALSAFLRQMLQARWLVPEGGQRLGSATRGRWALRVQRSHRVWVDRMFWTAKRRTRTRNSCGSICWPITWFDCSWRRPPAMPTWTRVV